MDHNILILLCDRYTRLYVNNKLHNSYCRNFPHYGPDGFFKAASAPSLILTRSTSLQPHKQKYHYGPLLDIPNAGYLILFREKYGTPLRDSMLTKGLHLIIVALIRI